MTLKIRVLGAHVGQRTGPVSKWTYHAEVYNDSDPGTVVWACEHDHESPQLAHGCAANWIEDAEQSPHAEQTA